MKIKKVDTICLGREKMKKKERKRFCCGKQARKKRRETCRDVMDDA